MSDPREVKIVTVENEGRKGYQPAEEQRGYKPLSSATPPQPPQGGSGTVSKPTNSNASSSGGETQGKP